MKLKAIPFSEISKQSSNIYKNVVVASRRAKQVITDRVATRKPYEDIADEDYPFNEEIIQEEYIELEKPIVVAVEELLRGELEWFDKLPEEIKI
ncbi:MAG: DNA-directed RNA polymerase subunit omega [Candidatus Marinimicrobia bacterium]|nr:DNA-directed RNA polymerase subunit omega [Candidatus Neomarinimicrobiota bacterium]